MYCVHCGKELNEKAVICPNCGIAVGSCGKEQSPAAGKTNALALWGFVLSLLQVVPGSYISYLSLALSLLALRRCVEHPEQYTGKRFAVAGVCFSVLGIVLFFILAAYGIYLLRLRMQGFLS